MFQLFKKDSKVKELTYSNLFKRIEELTSERDYYKNSIEHYKKEPNNIGKLIRLEEEHENSLEYQGYLEHLLKESKNENELLKDENSRLNDMCFDITQENSLMDNCINNLDYYNTKDLDNKQCADAIDKLTDEREVYKKVINVMCDKYNIEHDEVFNIIDDIQSCKDNQLEKEFI